MTGQKPASDSRWRSPFHVRMLVLAIAMLAMLAAVAMLAHRAWAQSAVARDRVQYVHRVSVWLGHQVREAVHALDTRMLRFKLGAGPHEWTEFQQELDEFRRWLDEQRSYLVSQSERMLLGRFEQELAGYDAAARLFATPTTMEPAGGEVAIEVTELSHRSKTLIELGFELAAAHQATADDVLADAGRENEQAQWTTYAALSLMLCVGGGMGWIVYRDSIAPMHRKLLESRRQLERQEKLAALGEMSAVVAHEIRNPLTAVKARLFTLRKLLTHDASAEDDARVIADEIDRLERIVREFLQFARPPEPVTAPVDPVAILRRVHHLVAPQWSTNAIRLELDATPAPAIEADGDQIEQAVLNLVQNAAQAIDASGKGSVVSLRAVSGEHPQTGAPGGGVRLEVTDDGPGIDPEVQGRLFDPFFTTRPNGTGLGLAFTVRIVEKHGGRVEFHTSPGRGTMFTLLLPITKT